MTEPTPISDLLGDVLSGLGIASPGDAVALIERWSEVTPEPWASRSTPISLRGGVLEVEVADGATASLLRYQERQLVEHLTREVGSGLISSVAIKVDRH